MEVRILIFRPGYFLISSHRERLIALEKELAKAKEDVKATAAM